MTAVVLDELDGGRPAGWFCFHARLGLVELHGLHVRGDLALGDHPDHGFDAYENYQNLQLFSYIDYEAFHVLVLIAEDEPHYSKEWIYLHQQQSLQIAHLEN